MAVTYEYRCESCGDESELQAAIGTARRMIRCGCGGVKRLKIGVGVNVSASALEARGGEVRSKVAMEGRWDDDMPAYARMRSKGLHPDSIDGAARVENEVGDQTDIVLRKPQLKDVPRERFVEAKEQVAAIEREARHG